VEIVWDLINVLREYLRFTLDEDEEEEKKDPKVEIKKRKFNVQNVLSGLLCAF
jgi:hypothetical protein